MESPVKYLYSFSAIPACNNTDVRLVGGRNESEVELRCALINSGGECVVTPRISEMQVLPADSLVSLWNVSYT